MFIAPDHPAHQRRSEERNESSEYHPSCVPLLRTALRTLSSRSYKHDTPAGVKTPDAILTAVYDNRLPSEKPCVMPLRG